MKTLEEALEILNDRIDRATLEAFIARQWVRPHQRESSWYFEDIDIARVELVCHLSQDIEVNDAGMDVALSLLDQLYGLRAHMKHITHAIKKQPPHVQTDIRLFIGQSIKADENH